MFNLWIKKNNMLQGVNIIAEAESEDWHPKSHTKW